MRITRRRNAIVLFITLGACLVALTITLNVTWIISVRSIILLVIGIPFFLLLIAGLILNTIFLVREVRRNERHDSFLNAVTHELKTPIASIRLYLETLQRHELSESKRNEFYNIMLSDSERLLATVEQVLKAGEMGQRGRNQVRLHLLFDEVVRDCIHTILQRYHLEESTIHFNVDPGARELAVVGNPEDLRTAVLNILDNAVKYSPEGPQLEVHLALEGDAWMMLTVSAPEANLQALLPRTGPQRLQDQGHRARSLPGSLHRPPAWRGRYRRIGGGRARHHHPPAASPGAVWRPQEGRGPAMSHLANILVVEDEAHLAQGLLFNLREEGYTAQLAVDGETALKMIAADPIDAVILDVMLPGRDGFSVAAELRAQQNFVPILMLTARGRPEDVLSGFDAGADDYLPKPFELAILLARLKGLLRRMAWLRPSLPASPPQPPRGGSPSAFHFAGRTIDFASLQLTTADKTIRLTLMECDLLRYLVNNQGRIISRKELLEQVWRVREDTDTRAIDNFMVRLRRYIEDNPAEPVFLETVRGIGYRFLPRVAEPSPS
jgi:DNA-binding response OmpR family regulator